nr:breast cancer type 1 susceptibility protein homolog [Onthophagus taurus]
MTSMSNLFVFKTAKQFSTFIQEINTLKEVIRCPMCGELVEDPLCASCNHTFCSQCVSICNNNKCPICKTTIKQVPINNYIKNLLAWLRKVDTQLKTTFNCDVFNLNYDEITLIFNKNFLKDSKDVVDSTSSVSTFDKLLNSVSLNHHKSKSVKKYIKKGNNKLNLESVKVDGSLSRKGEFKQDVFKWLGSTKNNFDRLLTQTQDAINEDSEDFLSLPSVSQKITQKKCTGRSKSFEIKPKGHVMKLRRRSNQELNHSDKEEVVRLLEEECLDRIEMDLNQKPVNKTSNSKSGWKRMKKMNKISNKNKGKLPELNVTLTSPSDNKENINKKLTPNQVIRDEKINKNRICFESPNINRKKRKLNDLSDSSVISLNKRVLIDQSTQTLFSITSTSIQTESIPEIKKKMRDVDTQTDPIDFNKENKLKNISIQTITFDTTKNVCTIETQTDIDDDIFEIKTQPIIIKKPSQKINNETPQNSALIVSLTNPKIHSKEECEERIAEMLKNYKRIVQVDSDSDTDDQNKPTNNKSNKSNKLKNKYIMDDLSVEIMSENIDSTKSSENLTLKNSNKVDYDRYYQNVMKKYENNDANNEPSTSKKKTESQNVYERCDAMIKNIVNKSQADNERKPSVKSSNKENIETTDLEIIEEFSKAFTTPQTITNKSQSDHDVLPCTEAMMENIDVEELERCFDLKENNRSNVSLEKEIGKSENKGIDEEKQSSNVVILQNVLMKKGRGNETVVEEEDHASAHSDDLFNNTDDEVQVVQYDEDVVQDSPKKVTNGGLEK